MLCACGCGNDAGVYSKSSLKGQPRKYIHGHSGFGEGGHWTKRFWSKVQKTDEAGCWNWTGSKTSKGYGEFSVKGKKYGSHRVSYCISQQILPEELQSSMFVLHSCDNPSCVNPEHLSLGTPLENSRQMIERKRHKEIECLDEKVHRFGERLNRGEPAYQLIREAGVSEKVFIRNMKRLGYRPTYRITDGESSRIVQMYESGKTFTEIGKLLGRDRNTVSKAYRKAKG